MRSTQEKSKAVIFTGLSKSQNFIHQEFPWNPLQSNLELMVGEVVLLTHILLTLFAGALKDSQAIFLRPQVQVKQLS